jgi:hypothetical protein
MDNIKLPGAAAIETESLNFIDKNFNYINLLLFAGLYIVCFIYLLQDTVKSITAEFSDIIGMFVGEAAFLIILFILMGYEEVNASNLMIWSVLIVAGLGQMISGGFLLLKYKNIQDRDGDNSKIKIDDPTAEILGDKFKTNFLEIYKYLLIGFDLAVIIIVAAHKFIPPTQYLNLVIGLLLMVVLCITGFMLYTSIVVSKAQTQKMKNPPESKIKPITIPALIILCVFHIFFTFFVSFIISKKASGPLNWLLKLSWGSVFITTIFQIISLFIIIITYKYLDDNFISKNISLPDSSNIVQELKDYNNLFVSVTSMIIVYIATLLKGHEFLNAQESVFFKPYYYSGFVSFLGIATLSMSSEMIKISDDFLTYKKLAPIPDAKTLDNIANTNTVK